MDDLKPKVRGCRRSCIEEGGGSQGQHPGSVLPLLRLPSCQVQQKLSLGSCCWHMGHNPLCSKCKHSCRMNDSCQALRKQLMVERPEQSGLK